MGEAVSRAIRVARTLEEVMHSDRGRLLAILSASLRDISIAEEVLQEAALAALTHWERHGPPASPQAWLLTVARRKAIDRSRVSTRETQRIARQSWIAGETTEDVAVDEIPDRRLGLIFACCHPALDLKSRVALTLRTVCGLTTAEIARAFLDTEPTMGQRLSRAKAKIAAAGVPFEVPEPSDWPDRLHAVLTTVYLIFTTGYVSDDNGRHDLCHEAEYLVRLIDTLHRGDPEIEGALAMMMLLSARRRARIGEDGAAVPPAEQDRELWDWPRIFAGRARLADAIARRRVGPFQIKAGIADCQTFEGGPDWPQIAALYVALWSYEPTPIVRLNAAVAIAEAGQPAKALAVVESLGDELLNFQPWHAARAALYAMCGDRDAAIAAYGRAIADAPGQAEALFLKKKLAALRQEDGVAR